MGIYQYKLQNGSLQRSQKYIQFIGRKRVKIGDYFQILPPERKKRQGGSQRIQRLRAWFFKWET